MGNMDKIVRVIVALAIAVLYFMEIISGTVALVLLAVGAIFLLTSLIGVCPLYLPFGISTRPRNNK